MSEEVVIHDVEVVEKKPRKPRAKKVEAKTEESFKEVEAYKSQNVPELTDFEKATNARREEQQKKIEDYMKRSDAAVSKLPLNKQVYWRDRLQRSGTEETFLTLLAQIETHPLRS